MLMVYHFFGGEPLELVNQEGLLPFLKKIRQELPEKNIWCWTGYNFKSDLLNNTNPLTKELLQYIDIIVDGQFEIENKLENLIFRGSTNQRKIDVQQSLKTGETVYMQFGDEQRELERKSNILDFNKLKKAGKILTKTAKEYKITVKE